MKKVVVTGATSMIGTALINECVANNCEVLAIVRKNSARLDRLSKSKLVNIIYKDLDELNTINIADEYDVFFHLAWDYTNKLDRDNVFLQTQNIETSLKAVELAKRLKCSKFIGAGSQAEYGICSEIINENTEPKPVTAYGMAKYATNMLTKRLCEQYGIYHIWGRIFSVYGINDNPGTMINYALEKFDNEEEAVFSNGKQKWNYLFEKDAGKMFYLLGKTPAESGIYCIANHKSLPLKQYVDEIADAYGMGAKYQFSDEESKVELNADISKFIKLTNYLPETDFRKGIENIISNRTHVLKTGGGSS